jgi:hypothetical protein
LASADRVVAGSEERADGLSRRHTELRDHHLADAPTRESVLATLQKLTDAASAVTVAEERLRRARDAVNTAEDARSKLGNAEREARQKLGGARDAVVAYGAPTLAGTSLPEDWAALAGWANGEARPPPRCTSRAGRR